MSTTHADAYGEMAARIATVATQQAVQTLLGYKPEIRYENVTYPAEPVGNKYWLRFTNMQAGQRKRTLGRPPRITWQGLAAVQIFTPVQAKEAAKVSAALAGLLLAAYQSPTANVDFMDSMLKDLPREAQWYVKQVSATYNYDTFERGQ